MKKWISIVLSLVMLLGMITCQVFAAEQAITDNQLGHDYVNFSRWPLPSYSALSYDESTGTFTRVEYDWENILVEHYDEGLKLLSGRKMELELPIYGGFYSGKNHYFLVFGQMNPEEDDSKEVIRVVKYDKNWNRLAQASLCGANTTVPFDAGGMDLYEYNGYLYLRTAHEMYQSSDGLNHQSNLTMNIRISDMQITDAFYDVMNSKYGYVSHSFNQFIRVDESDGSLVALDHGDAHPRSVVLTKYFSKAGQDKFTDPVMLPVPDKPGYFTWAVAETEDVLPIVGGIGENDTGVSVGGFEVSDDAYLSVGTSIEQNPDRYYYFSQRNVYLTVTKKDLSETKVIWLTDFKEEDYVDVNNPHLVRLSGDRFLIVWSDGEYEAKMHHVFVDGEGNLLTQVFTRELEERSWLSDCKPIVAEGKVIWYMTDGEELRFFAIDEALGSRMEVLEQGETEPQPTDPSDPEETEPTDPSDPEETEPTDPTDPEETEPTDPSDPEETEPTDPTDPEETEPTNPTDPTEPEGPVNPFVDVAEGKFYYEPVLWAVENNITKGIDDTHFAPLDGCSRAHVVTFLWRAAGSPEPGSAVNPFTDVVEGKFYYTAVLWAVEEGITKGISDTEFAPNQTCTRGQIVTFLWRYAGQPKAEGAGDAFTDLKPGAFYTDAVAWAVEAEVTNGMGNGKFAPNDTCTRGQVVTFLQRSVD